MSDKKERIVWIDLLRIVATWGVISIHGKSCYDFSMEDYKWVEFQLLGFLFTFCVPVFLMLSGYLSLQKESSISVTVRKRVPKVIWMKMVSLGLCAVSGVLYALVTKKSVEDTAQTAVREWGYGTSYLAVLAGCYLVVPFLYKIVEDKKYEEYFLILAFIFCFIVPSFTDLEYVRDVMPKGVISIMRWLDSGQVYIPVGSAALFVLGHYLGVISKKFNKKGAVIFFLIGLGVWVSSSFWQVANLESRTILSALRYGRYYGGYVAPLVTLYAASVFIFFKVVLGDVVFPEKVTKVIKHLGRNSVMIFLLHGIVISVVRPWIPIFWMDSFFVETVVDVTIYFVICFIISLVLERIPLVNKII